LTLLVVLSTKNHLMKNYISIIIASTVIFICSCGKTIDNTGTCSDGVKNQGEQGVDCGGPCGAPCPSCADGIKNQDEVAVDCGGSCDSCYATFTANINNVQWNSTSRSAFLSGPTAIRIYGTNQLKNITLNYSGPFVTGSVANGTNFQGEVRDENGNLYASTGVGTIQFFTFDTVNHKISGIYNFIATDTLNHKSILVSSGVFTELSY
jgi:hypothetical protein